MLSGVGIRDPQPRAYSYADQQGGESRPSPLPFGISSYL